MTEIPAPRMFWPREVWGLYASKLDEFKEPVNRTAAVQCLNHLVGDSQKCSDSGFQDIGEGDQVLLCVGNISSQKRSGSGFQDIGEYDQVLLCVGKMSTVWFSSGNVNSVVSSDRLWGSRARACCIPLRF